MPDMYGNLTEAEQRRLLTGYADTRQPILASGGSVFAPTPASAQAYGTQSAPLDSFVVNGRTGNQTTNKDLPEWLRNLGMKGDAYAGGMLKPQIRYGFWFKDGKINFADGTSYAAKKQKDGTYSYTGSDGKAATYDPTDEQDAYNKAYKNATDNQGFFGQLGATAGITQSHVHDIFNGAYDALRGKGSIFGGTPLGTKLSNAVTGRNDKPIADQFGGPTKDQSAKYVAENGQNSLGYQPALHAVGSAIGGFYAGQYGIGQLGPLFSGGSGAAAGTTAGSAAGAASGAGAGSAGAGIGAAAGAGLPEIVVTGTAGGLGGGAAALGGIAGAGVGATLGSAGGGSGVSSGSVDGGGGTQGVGNFGAPGNGGLGVFGNGGSDGLTGVGSSAAGGLAAGGGIAGGAGIGGTTGGALGSLSGAANSVSGVGGGSMPTGTSGSWLDWLGNNAGTIAGLANGLLNNGGKKNQTTTTTNEPPAYLLPYLQQAAQGATSLFGSGGPQYFPGPTLAGQSQNTTDALTDISARARAGSPLVSTAQQFVQNGLQQPISSNYGDSQNPYASTVTAGTQAQNPYASASNPFGGASNPYLDATFDQALQKAQSGVESQYARAGRNVTASQPVMGDIASNLATQIYAPAYESERNRQLQYQTQLNDIGSGAFESQQARQLQSGLAGQQIGAQGYENAQGRQLSDTQSQRSYMDSLLGYASPLAAQDYNDLAQLQGAGANQDLYSQQQIDDARARYDYGQNQPGQTVDDYIRRLTGLAGTGSTSTTSQPLYSNKWSDALGQAMLLQQLQNSFRTGT